MMHLIFKNDRLFAVDEQGKFVGEIINDPTGNCVEAPELYSSGAFAQLFGGHGYIYHLSDNPPNLFWRRPEEVFTNLDLLPKGTVNVFVDQSKNAENIFNAIRIYK